MLFHKTTLKLKKNTTVLSGNNWVTKKQKEIDTSTNQPPTERKGFMAGIVYIYFVPASY